MKKLKYLLTIFLVTQINAQDVFDAMRYANDGQFGTARFSALGGAMGALGGDFSSVSQNPAGSAIFNNNQATATLSSLNANNKATYFGNQLSENRSKLDLNQVGAVWVFTAPNTNGFNKFAFSMNYEKTHNFNNSTESVGINPTNSVASYFTSYANGINVSDLEGVFFEDLNYRYQQAYLGYQGYIINPASNNQYTSNLTGNGKFYQENSIKNTGYNGKANFNIATSYKDRFYFGLNLNAHFTDYTRHTSFYEDYEESPGHNQNSGVQALRFSNDLYTYGTGFSFQFGTIAKVTENFRVGLSYDSPTWYSLNDELQQTLAVNCPDCGTNSTNFFVDPGIKFIYPTYNLRTPGKATASLAYIFGKKGLVSFDYTFKDYNSTRYSDAKQYQYENYIISQTFSKSTSQFRAGAEYRIKQWSLRGGYRFEQSPYIDKKTIGDLYSYSGGLGYNFNEFKIDLSYTLTKQDRLQSFFSQGFTDTSTVKSTLNNVALTCVFEF